MKKKFDVNKFIKILLTPQKYKKFLNKKGKPLIDYPNKLGLDTKKFHYGYLGIKEAVKKYRKEVINRKFPSKKNLYN